MEAAALRMARAAAGKAERQASRRPASGGGTRWMLSASAMQPAGSFPARADSIAIEMMGSSSGGSDKMHDRKQMERSSLGRFIFMCRAKDWVCGGGSS